MEKLRNDGYKNLLTEVQDIISKGKNKVYKTVDNILVETRWQIGERIVREELKYQERADYEQYLVNNLADDLKVRKRFLYEIIKFYKVYPIVRALRAQLSWRHYTTLVGIKNQKERTFYENKIIYYSWSYRELSRQIKNKLYQNTNQKEVTNLQKNIAPAIIDIQRIFKSEYNLDFLSISENHQEKELEDKIVNNIVSFLKEFGGDFSFLGRQVPILIDDEKHFIDLLLHNHGIPCTILVDLKIGKITSQDIGQMNKYVSYYRYNKQYTHEQAAIGLIIGREAGREEVFYALDGLVDKIFIAKYKTKLPSEAKIKRIIKEL